MSSQRTCLICSAPSTYAHFGVNSCRSCADFFKRTVTTSRSYTCCQGDDRCSMRANDRRDCRGCRFRKCQALGMRIDPKSAEIVPVSFTDAHSPLPEILPTHQRSCLVCTAPSTYAHFGVNSCRSCAEFFKRTVVAGRAFTCRQGDGKCAINPRDRHNCRGCRFRKCESLGMKYEAKNADILPTASPSSPDKTYYQECVQSGEAEEEKKQSVKTEKRSRLSQFIDHTTFFKYEPHDSLTPLLDKITKGFSIMCLIRLSGEKKFASGSSKQLPVDNLIIYRASYCTMIPIHNFLKEGIMEFGNFAFNEFRVLDKTVKQSFVERRITCMDMLESTYRACHHFPDCKDTRMPGYTTYFTNSDVEEVFETCDDDVDKPKLMREWKQAVTQLSRMVRYHLEIVKPTDYEFAALLGLVFWNDEYADDSLTATANKVRAEIIQEVHVYYKEQGIVDATRLGQLFCLLVNCQECSVKVDEDYEVFRLMNMFEHSLNL